MGAVAVRPEDKSQHLFLWSFRKIKTNQHQSEHLPADWQLTQRRAVYSEHKTSDLLGSDKFLQASWLLEPELATAHTWAEHLQVLVKVFYSWISEEFTTKLTTDGVWVSTWRAREEGEHQTTECRVPPWILSSLWAIVRFKVTNLQTASYQAENILSYLLPHLLLLQNY